MSWDYIKLFFLFSLLTILVLARKELAQSNLFKTLNGLLDKYRNSQISYIFGTWILPLLLIITGIWMVYNLEYPYLLKKLSFLGKLQMKESAEEAAAKFAGYGLIVIGFITFISKKK